MRASSLATRWPPPSAVSPASPVRFSEHLDADGPTMLAHACRIGLEGILSKRKDPPYVSGRGEHWLKMDGREVFRRAVRVMVQSAKAAMERAGVTADDIALVVPHQANIRIIDSACDKLGFDREQTALVLQSTGNTSAASIPLALAAFTRTAPKTAR